MSAFTTDSFFNGQIVLRQEKNGYRFSIDSILAARHAEPRPGDVILDLGAGCGVISIITALVEPGVRRIYGVEIQRELAEIARWNVKANNMEDKIKILRRDLKDFQSRDIPERATLVVSNPPFRKNRSGRQNPNPQKAAARHEIMATLRDVTGTAGRALGHGGRLVMIYPSHRLTDLLTEMRRSDLEPKWMRVIHSSPESAAKLVIVSGTKGGRPGMETRAPFFIYKKDGDYSKETRHMFERPAPREPEG
ncbi:SAM-dependent methyltransferase [Candidatus Desulfarcum epimagneticum]|uniref:SAM-dependent methyltransferase n=1 Tax=uncultured Desulfobacteraceae bacterium TaxID=218296 RepID=A0A484HE89_9BACT|nr:SAM-dependent methyltransferase [uncultured Desulfobacteraceae bacterium]